MKKNYHLPFIVFCLLLLTNSAFAADSQLPIDSIGTAGNHTISSTQILAKVRSRVGQLFDAATADEDARRIAQLDGVEYAYYNTAIAENKVQLTFVVVERNIVRKIAFVGRGKFRANLLKAKVDLKRGDYLDPVLAEAGRKAIAEFYRKKGYAFVQVSLDNDKLAHGELIYTIAEGPRVKIESVGFKGNSDVKTRALKTAIKTKRKKMFFWPRYYIKETVTKDVEKLQNIYQKKGFLDTGITTRLDFTEDDSRVRIIFVIDEGRRFTVEKISITGNDYFKESRLQAELKLKEGQIYSEWLADSDVKRLLKLYRENGFIDAQIEQKRRFVSGKAVNVEFKISQGQRFRIGRISITGNEQTQDKVVRRVLDEYDFQPGQWFNADIARGDGSGKLEKLVGRMAMTESGTSFITSSGEMPDQRDAQVSIIEGQTGMVMMGGGVGSDSGAFAQLMLEQRNFDISDWPESFGEFITGKAFKGAGQNFRIDLRPGTEVDVFSVSFSEPYFQDKPIRLDVSGSSYERWMESYDEKRLKGYVGLEKRYKNHWRRSIGFRVETVNVAGLDGDAPQEIIDVKGDNSIAAVRLGVGRDLTDDRFNPSTGYNFNASYEQAGGDHTFGILNGTYRWYRTLYEDLIERKTILATKLLAATTVGDAPPFEKFYGGGTGTYGIRGFDYRGVSTRGLQTSIANPKYKDPIGSDWIFLANAEVTVPLVGESLSALFFVDSGAIDSGNYRAAVGTGIQILIPHWFGPVPMRFEIAAPVMKDDDDDTQAFSFSMGRLF